VLVVLVVVRLATRNQCTRMLMVMLDAARSVHCTAAMFFPLDDRKAKPLNHIEPGCTHVCAFNDVSGWTPNLIVISEAVGEIRLEQSRPSIAMLTAVRESGKTNVLATICTLRRGAYSCWRPVL
jgi:hypothetical protein